MKDLLEESAAWTGPSSQAGPTSPRGEAARQALQAEARAADAEARASGLTTALARAALSSRQLESAVLPLLLGIETELSATLAA